MRPVDIVNAVKNIGAVRNIYRAVVYRRVAADLARRVASIKPLGADEYRAGQATPFARLRVSPRDDRERELLQHPSVGTYFRLTPAADDTVMVSDQYPNSLFETRQRMLATVYRQWDRGTRLEWSLLDLAGSLGYYAFLAEAYGFRQVEVTDARAEHRDQFGMLQRALGDASRVRFRQEDALDVAAGTHDVILAQGILYHVYDHFSFLRALYAATRRVLVLETELSGYGGLLALAKFEDVSDSRMGTKGPALYPSYGTVLGLLEAVGFNSIRRVSPPADRADYHGYRRGRRVMLICEK